MSNTITRALGAVAIAGTLAGAAYAGTAAAHASGSDEFINHITAYGWHEYYSGATLNLGYRTCSLLNSGYSWNTVVNDVYWNTDAGTSWNAANGFVAIADAHLC